MPYLKDPRRTVTVNLHPDEYAVLAEDALEAGYATPGTFAKALVLAHGAAPAPVLDRRSEERIHRLEGKNEVQQELRAAAEARAATLRAQLAEAHRQLAQRPPLAEVQQAITDGVAAAWAERETRAAEDPAPLTPEEAAAARRQRVAQRRRESR